MRTTCNLGPSIRDTGLTRVHYWLLLTIANMPKAFTYGAGILVASALIAATAATVLYADQRQTAERHDTGVQIAQAIAAESTPLLEHLATHSGILCDKQGLIHLNAHLLQTRYIREIGLLDADNRLTCSTALGLLPEPVQGNYPVITTRSGLRFLHNVPLQMANKALRATIIQRGSFNVVVSPYAIESLYASADAAWLRTADRLTLLHSAEAPENLAFMRHRADKQEKTTFTFHKLGYELITVQPELNLVLQSRRSLASIVQESGILLPSMLTGSLLFALLTVGAFAPYVVKLCGIQNRVRFLCNDKYILLIYQPIFDLRTMKPTGCEVLMRMREGKNVWMPDQIIPEILNAGLARRFDHAVTRQAIHELGRRLPVRNAQNGKFMLALNYFPESIDQATLIPLLNDAVKATGRDDIEICIEITEHSISSELTAEVKGLKAHGLRIAIDDFGTGYSNLKSVKKLAPDLLKIDKSFVFELEDATVRSNLIPEIVNIAQAVQAQTVAEGIENIEQAPLLAAQNVRYGQGYALARPMELEALLAFLQTHQ